MNVDFSVIQQSGGSGLRQTNQWAFTEPYRRMAQTGRNLQWLGATGTNLAIAEQDTQNTNLVNSTNAQRKIQYSKLKTQLLQPETFNPETYEKDLGDGLLAINKLLATPGKGQSYNSRVTGLIQAEGTQFYASQIGSIQKEARVFRVKALKAQGLENIRALRQEEIKMPDIPSNRLLKQDIDATMMQLIDDMVTGGLLDPDEGVKEKNKIRKDREDAHLRQVIDDATSMSDVNDALDVAQHQSEEELEILRIRGKDNIKQNRKDRIANEERLRKKGERERKARLEANEADFDGRIFDPTKFSDVTLKELRQARDDQKISKTYFDSRVVMVQRGDPYADRPTNPEVYDQVAAQIEEQLKYPDRPIIKISDINSNPSLGNDVRKLLTSRLSGRQATLNDKKTGDFRKKLKEALLIEAYTKLGKIKDAQNKRNTLVLFDRRVAAGEDAEAVATELINKEMELNTKPLSPVSLVDTQVKLNDLPPIVRSVEKNKDGVEIPNVRVIINKLNAALENKQITEEEYIEAEGIVTELRKKFSDQFIEQQTGIKSPATLKKELMPRTPIVDSKPAQVDAPSVAPRKPPGEVKFGLRNVQETMESGMPAVKPGDQAVQPPVGAGKPSPGTVATPSRQPVNVPEPRPVPQNIQPKTEQWEFGDSAKKNLTVARETIQYLRKNAEEHGYNSQLISLLELTLLSLEADADLKNKEQFEKTWQSFMKQVGVIRGND